jgi:hypothetical protein
MEQQLENLGWRKSKASGSGGGQCVEVATVPGMTLVRDSKSPERGHLTVTPETFGALLGRVKRGELDLGEQGARSCQRPALPCHRSSLRSKEMPLAPCARRTRRTSSTLMTACTTRRVRSAARASRPWR